MSDTPVDIKRPRMDKHARYDIRITVTETENQLLRATLTGWTLATDSDLSAMTSLWPTVAQGAICGLIIHDPQSVETTGSEDA